MTWAGTVNFHKHLPDKLSDFQERAIQTYMSCLDEWHEFLEKLPLPSEMCLKPGASHPVVISAAGELSPLADYFLALVYRPAKSFHSNNSLENNTMNIIILPELSSSLYIEEFLPLGLNQNADVDLSLLKKRARDPTHWMCKNFSTRVQAVTILRRTCGKNSITWLGGPDVCDALAAYVTSCSVIELVKLDVATGLNGQIFIRASQHPSAPLLRGMSRQVVETTRSSLRLFKAIVDMETSNQFLSIENVRLHLSTNEALRLQRKQENIRWILENFSTTPDPLKIAKKRVRSILHYHLDGPKLMYAMFRAHVVPKLLLRAIFSHVISLDQAQALNITSWKEELPTQICSSSGS